LTVNKAAAEVAHGQAVRFGDFENMVGGKQTAGTGHILDQNRRLAGNVFRHMPRQHPRQRIITAAGGIPDNDTNRFALKEIVLPLSLRCSAQAGNNDHGAE
jgi:alkylated DNA nucleotide flippase Atl1